MRTQTLVRCEHVLDQLAAVHAFFREKHEDPNVYSPDFFHYWIVQGKTPAQIFRIACNQKES
jgi:hypothetical protein